MRTGVKVALCILLMLFAAWSALSVLESIGALPALAPETAEAEAEGYLVGEYQGFVAVWYPAGAGYPAMITELRAADLPLSDRAALRDGIPAADREAVVRLLEDLTS